MYNAFLEQTQKRIDALRKYISVSDVIRSAIHEKTFLCKADAKCFDQSPLSTEKAPDRVEWRLIEHCTTVTRIYAIYEQFSHEMLREHIGLLQKNLPFSAFPEEVRQAYRRGISAILEKKDGPRYAHLDLRSLVEQYGKALAGQPYTLEPLALLVQEQNLRIHELARLFSGCGIENIASWIDQHPSVIDFFAAGGRLGASADHEMRELIKYRNDAAHGSIDIDELPGIDYLFEFCDFISAICAAVSERVQLVGLQKLIDAGIASKRGKIDECLKNREVIIGKLTGKFRVGDIIYLHGSDYCVAREIKSIQIDGADQREVALSSPTELGLAINGPGRKRATVTALDSSVSRNEQNGN